MHPFPTLSSILVFREAAIFCKLEEEGWDGTYVMAFTGSHLHNAVSNEVPLSLSSVSKLMTLGGWQWWQAALCIYGAGRQKFNRSNFHMSWHRKRFIGWIFLSPTPNPYWSVLPIYTFCKPSSKETCLFHFFYSMLYQNHQCSMN